MINATYQPLGRAILRTEGRDDPYRGRPHRGSRGEPPRRRAGALSDVYGVQAPASFERFMGASDIFERIDAQLGPKQMADATRRGRAMTIDEVQTYLLERLDALGVEPAEA